MAEDPPALIYTAEEAAPVIKKTAYWLKTHARKGDIPFTRIGRSYLWTADQLAEIVRAGEHRPRVQAPYRSAPWGGRPAEPDNAFRTPLRANIPRRKCRSVPETGEV